jgi:alpha-tubulin suppressor-like RCC1 family protein
VVLGPRLQMTSDPDWQDVACGDHFTCAVKLDGTRWCTGVNDFGELGDAFAWIPSLTVVP